MHADSDLELKSGYELQSLSPNNIFNFIMFLYTRNFPPVLSAIYENHPYISVCIFHFEHWV